MLTTSPLAITVEILEWLHGIRNHVTTVCILTAVKKPLVPKMDSESSGVEERAGDTANK